ncbi:hypothetical protein KEJ19_06160 [Candidatus Bathyarchaeota archaeon]|nr:hypothetical protein [Candidatus Bathyarchaeota archaeon]
MKKNYKFGRDYISNLNRGSIPPENLEEILRKGEFEENGEAISGMNLRLRGMNSRLKIKLQNESRGSKFVLQQNEAIVTQPMISSYRSFLKELEAKRSRGITSMLG